MLRQKKKHKLNAEINVVPYIDVMMVLLVIFMITAPMMTQGVDVDLPKVGAKPVDTRDEEPLIISVNAAGEFFINVGGEPDAPVSLETVSSRVEKILNSNPKKQIFVRGDRAVNYERVINLMAALQRSGAPSVGLVTE
jgi:biopolymer transport protein TolR